MIVVLISVGDIDYFGDPSTNSSTSTNSNSDSNNNNDSRAH